MIGRVDHRSRRNLGLVLLQGSLGGAWGLHARTRGLQLTLLDRHREAGIRIACEGLGADMSTEYYVASQIAECGNALGKTTKEV